MGQLSLFSAELDPPELGDLAGLLAGPGQVVRIDGKARVSVVVASRWRAERIAEDIAAAGLRAEIGESHDGGVLVRTEVSDGLTPLAAGWTKGAGKTVPDGWVPRPRELRFWALASGQSMAGLFQFGVDPHSPDTHFPLAGALAEIGLTPLLVGPRNGGPALRVSGRRRLLRIAETLGPEPDGAREEQCWPQL